jgi:biopolymer transport protein ExbB
VLIFAIPAIGLSQTAPPAKAPTGQSPPKSPAPAAPAAAAPKTPPSPTPPQPATPGPEPAVRVQSSKSADEPAPATPAGPHSKVTHHRTIPTSPIEIAEALGVSCLTAFLVLSVIAVWFTSERLLVLRRGRVIPRHFVERFLQNLEQGNLEPNQALRLCEDNGSPMAVVFAHGIRKWGKPGVEVEQAIIDGGERQVNQLRSHLRALSAISTIAPLVGLLGTVIGMIQCFNEIANSQGMGKADQLAGGIGIALLATAAGLFIAIFSLTMYMFLSGRADAIVIDMDLLAQDIVQLVSAEAIADGAQSAGKARPRRGSPPTPEPKQRSAV